MIDQGLIVRIHRPKLSFSFLIISTFFFSIFTPFSVKADISQQYQESSQNNDEEFYSDGFKLKESRNSHECERKRHKFFPRGPRGPTGPTGPTGTDGLFGDYAYVYTQFDSPETIQAGNNIPFYINGPIKGITHTPLSDSITIAATAVYAIDYNVLYSSSTDGFGIYMTINGSHIDSTLTILIVSSGELSNSFLLELNQNDVITMIVGGLNGSIDVVRASIRLIEVSE